MTSWVALLRGINVNGVTIRNADLAAVFRDEGHADVATVLASGNVRFRAQAEAADQVDVALFVFALEVVEQLAALRDQLQQTKSLPMRLGWATP